MIVVSNIKMMRSNVQSILLRNASRILLIRNTVETIRMSIWRIQRLADSRLTNQCFSLPDNLVAMHRLVGGIEGLAWTEIRTTHRNARDSLRPILMRYYAPI